MSTHPGGFSRHAEYDEMTISLLRRIDAARERRNRELEGPWTDHWNDIVALAQDHLSPIVKIYTELDLGEMAKYVVRKDPTPDEFVHELSRHPRSFIELGVPTFLSKLSRNLERLLFEVGTRPVKANSILELAYILKETARIFPDKLPKSKEDTAEEPIDEEEGEAALEALKQGKQILRDEYYKIKESIEGELNANPDCNSRDRAPRDEFRGHYETQDFGSGWDDCPRLQRHRSTEYNSYQEEEEEMEDRFPQRHHSGGGFSARPAPRVEGARTGRPMGGSSLSPAAFSTIPVRPQGGGPQRSNSSGTAPVRRPGGYSSRPPPPHSTDLRRSVSDTYRNQSNWEAPEQDSPSGWDSGSGNRGSHSTRGYSSRPTSNVRRDQRNGDWANSTSQDAGSSRRSKKESKPKSKTPKSRSVSEPGWGPAPEAPNEANNGRNNATRGASRTNTDSEWGGGGTAKDVPESNKSAWGSGSNVNESAWGTGNNWAQSTSNTQENRGADSDWGSTAPTTTTSRRGPPPGFGPPSSGGNPHPSYPPGFGPRDEYEGQGEDDMEASEQYY